MSRSVRVLAYIIGAKWFLPISFIVAMIAAVPFFSWFDERHIEKGDTPHSLFFVVWQPGEAAEPFAFSKLEDRSRIKASAPARSFIMEQPSGRIETGKSTVVAYKVLSSDASEQRIEVAYADDTYSSWSRYRATRSAVMPLFSKVMEPGQMFMAFRWPWVSRRRFTHGARGFEGGSLVMTSEHRTAWMAGARGFNAQARSTRSGASCREDDRL